MTLPGGAAEEDGESCGGEPYSNTIGNASAKSDGGTPTDETATTAADGAGETEDATLEYPDMAAEPDGGTEWSLTERVVGMPDAGDGGG